MITKQYTVTTADFSNTGEMLEQVRDFPKSREGLNDAYKFARHAQDWSIWCGDELVGDSSSPVLSVVFP
tara:strand:- start:562 stop:768 length:207 start_codon:yes stop_codon:yes gene_type:complete